MGGSGRLVLETFLVEREFYEEATRGRSASHLQVKAELENPLHPTQIE